jgi:hypothetical protein
LSVSQKDRELERSKKKVSEAIEGYCKRSGAYRQPFGWSPIQLFDKNGALLVGPVVNLQNIYRRSPKDLSDAALLEELEEMRVMRETTHKKPFQQFDLFFPPPFFFDLFSLFVGTFEGTQREKENDSRYLLDEYFDADWQCVKGPNPHRPLVVCCKRLAKRFRTESERFSRHCPRN